MARNRQQEGRKKGSKVETCLACGQQGHGLTRCHYAFPETKLRHVDIHNYLLRERAERDEIRVEYKASGEMLANGLTKALPNEHFEKFGAGIGLEDVSGITSEGKVKALGTTDMEA